MLGLYKIQDSIPVFEVGSNTNYTMSNTNTYTGKDLGGTAAKGTIQNEAYLTVGCRMVVGTYHFARRINSLGVMQLLTPS